MSKTKIICTIGPASEKPAILLAMISAGMDVARLNFSHGNHEEHQQRLNVIRELSGKAGHEVKILQDLEGLRIRIGTFKDGTRTSIEVKQKQIVVLTNQEIVSDFEIIPLDFLGPLPAINSGDFIYIDDGNIALQAIDVSEKFAKCEIVVPGDIKEHKGVNIPNANFPPQDITEKDRLDLEFGIKNRVDFIAQSFVQGQQDIINVRDNISKYGFECQLIAKIENGRGVENLAEIMDVSDGIMIARGDLGVSLPIYEVPILQKRIIKICGQKRKFVITATQMLESMTGNPRPTRAEVSDVANAVLDGSDYVMLSGETAIGEYPVETVSMMKKIINYTERPQDNYELI